MCRFVELIGEVMAQSTPYVTRVIESSVQEQDCKDELTRRHVIDERVTHAIEALTSQDEFFARYVPLVAACVMSSKYSSVGPSSADVRVRPCILVSRGTSLAGTNDDHQSRCTSLVCYVCSLTDLQLARQYLPLLHDVRVKGEFVAEVLGNILGHTL
eukprot:TRINITY_DN2206_c0_g1_i3.p1 TRINITY_DN2206_c0_g1~~TRINITY_DN2206_c0_g1_i3.p1  ORF type:complete len:157 (-),score=28.72 TRINITY_DN2206_c0_g1_i3:811-1281(-)